MRGELGVDPEPLIIHGHLRQHARHHVVQRAHRQRLARTASPHKILDTGSGPLIAVRLNIIACKTLGGIQANLDGRVRSADGAVVPGLWAAGEITGFGGGGVHGYRSLEGTFLGGCLFSGRQAGRDLAREV